MDSRLIALQKARERLPSDAAFSGFTALWLHGLDFDPCDPIEVTVPAAAHISTRAGMVVRRRRLERADVTKVHNLRATTMVRTIRDLCLRLPLTEAVVVADMALKARRISRDSLGLAAACHGHGVTMLRRVLTHVEPLSESPMETRLRMLLVLAGLPRPEAQVTIWSGILIVGRVDLYYREARLGIEYDGATHEGNLAEDNRRQNRLLEAGVRLLRFTAGDIYNTPDVVVSQVRRELQRRAN